jgi:hypothetical protein
MKTIERKLWCNKTLNANDEPNVTCEKVDTVWRRGSLTKTESRTTRPKRYKRSHDQIADAVSIR